MGSSKHMYAFYAFKCVELVRRKQKLIYLVIE